MPRQFKLTFGTLPSFTVLLFCIVLAIFLTLECSLHSQQQRREKELRKQQEREQRRHYEEQMRREEERRRAEHEQVTNTRSWVNLLPKVKTTEYVLNMKPLSARRISLFPNVFAIFTLGVLGYVIEAPYVVFPSEFNVCPLIKQSFDNDLICETVHVLMQTALSLNQGPFLSTPLSQI